jgi:hypothetical protein
MNGFFLIPPDRNSVRGMTLISLVWFFRAPRALSLARHAEIA